ncbi:unnamed protein product, partial [Mesorhabditis belari]|uniref:Uncharacterized protein n=1 Tax=Mesorhabditis belari TaxID=2138241 RepID=A0AAF3F7Z7_9BILA
MDRFSVDSPKLGSSPSKRRAVEAAAAANGEPSPEQVTQSVLNGSMSDAALEEQVLRSTSPPPNMEKPDGHLTEKELQDRAKEKKAKKVKKVKLTEKMLQDYITLEKAVYRLERKNVIKKYEQKMIGADEMKKTFDQLEATYKELKKQTEKEKADMDNIEQPSVKTFLKSQGTWESRLGKEKEEYLDAVRKQENAEKALVDAKQKYDRASKIADLYKQQSDDLQGMYEKQDQMLTDIFGSEYVSEKENQLEGELEDLVEWQQRVNLAMFKWTNGRVLLVHANTQMAFGISRWQELKKIETSNGRMRYFAAAEARNNFIAAGQNVQSCRVYLGKVQFPYATEDEMTQMENTVNSAFKDVQNDSTIDKAARMFQETHVRITSLIQWFDKVIHDTICKDLDKANDEVIRKQRQLREERLAIMKKKCKEELGHDMQFEYDHVDDSELEKELLALEQEALRDEQNGKNDGLKELLNLSQPEGPGGVPLSKLAPIPSKDALFGDVKQKLDEYGNTRKAFGKRNQEARERQKLALQEKLKQRQQNGSNSDLESLQRPPAPTEPKEAKEKGATKGTVTKKKKSVKRVPRRAVAPISEEVTA